MDLRRVVVVVLLGWGAARAEAPTGDRDEAKHLKDLANQSIARNDYRSALSQLQRAYRIFPSPNLRYNIGLALLKLGRDLEAIAEFEGFLGQALDAPDEVRRLARHELETIERRLGRCIVTTNLSGAEVWGDDQLMGVTPLPFPLYFAPGAHDVSLRRAGYLPFVTHIVVPAGSTRRVDVQLEPAATGGGAKTLSSPAHRR